MKVKRDDKTKKFKDFYPGDLFGFGMSIYMKVVYNELANVNAVSILSGHLTKISDEAPLTALEATLVVD